MVTNRWQKIEQVFNEAVLLSGRHRSSFVEEHCAGDPELLEQVNSLLSADSATDDILEHSVFPLVAHLLDEDFGQFLENPDFGHYKFKRLLGRGGMGAVFLAEDKRLEREVAIKILPAALTQNRDTVNRFEHEAKTASAISHHNVAHIYEFGIHEGVYFLAMEYVAGKTLRQLISAKQMDLNRAINVVLQVTEALRAAHKEGIIHRDIKPENIIFTENRIAKVLDFGLAKLGENNRRKVTSSFKTVPGVLIGTTAYMSPEQLRGKKIDERTDLWSLGVLFYEMLEGRRPFEGDTPSDVQAAILLSEPAPVKIGKDYPSIGKIINKALMKEAPARYQTADELCTDIKTAQKEIYTFEEKKLKKASGKSGVSSQPVYKSWLGAIVLLLTLLVVVAAGDLLLKSFVPPQSKQLTVIQSTRINNSGKAVRAALSPDGKYLAYVLEEKGLRGLFLQQREDGIGDKLPETNSLLPPSEQKFNGLVFTPDERQIYFTASAANKNVSSLYRIALGGGEPQKVLDNITGAPTFSPDSRQIAFLRLSPDNSHEDIWLADADGTGERLLYTRRMPDYIPHLTCPAWSPDGQVIIVSAGSYNHSREEVVPLAIKVSDGSTRAVFNTPWEEIWQMDWAPDGSGFIMTGREDKSYDNKQLWFVSYPDGGVTRLTRDFNDYFGVSISRTSSGQGIQLVSVILNRMAPLWKVDLMNPNLPALQITENGNDSLGVDWTGEKIVYGSMASGTPNIWSIDENGKNTRQITSGARLEAYPILTADGRYIVYGSEKMGTKSIWRMNADGSGQIPLVQNAGGDSMAVSPDGKTVYYYSYFNDENALWRIPINGGQAEKIIAGTFEYPSISPDNRFIASCFSDPKTEETEIAVWEIKNSPETRRLLKPAPGAALPGSIKWTPDGKAVTYAVNTKGVGNLWSQPIDGGPPRQITNFTSSHIYSFDWSPTGHQAVCARGEITGYATLLFIKN